MREECLNISPPEKLRKLARSTSRGALANMMMAASTPEAGAGAGAEGAEQEQSTFDIFVQSIDLRWCLLLHCDYASLTAIRQLCSAFLQHVPGRASSNPIN